MNRLTISRIIEFLRRKMMKKRWQRVVVCLSALAVFVTTYALVLPAITMTRDHPSLTAEETEAVSGDELVLHISARAEDDEAERVVVLTSEGEGADLSDSYAFDEEGVCLITDETGREIELHRSLRKLSGSGAARKADIVSEAAASGKPEGYAVDYWFTLTAGEQRKARPQRLRPPPLPPLKLRPPLTRPGLKLSPRQAAAAPRTAPPLQLQLPTPRRAAGLPLLPTPRSLC